MMQRIRKTLAHEGGFTLIELLIVIVILGILAAIVVFAVNGINDRGHDAACKAEKTTLTAAEEAYFAKTTPGSYAASTAALNSAGLLASPTTVYWNVSGGGASYTLNKVDSTCP